MKLNNLGLLGTFTFLIVGYLVLTHSTEFVKDIGGIGEFVDKAAYTFQGRGSQAG
jgi:hypothetical protein